MRLFFLCFFFFYVVPNHAGYDSEYMLIGNLLTSLEFARVQFLLVAVMKTLMIRAERSDILLSGLVICNGLMCLGLNCT